MAATLALTAPRTAPAYSKLVSSAASFKRHFKSLEHTRVSPIERLVFSLVLANSETPRVPMPGGTT